MRKILRFVTAFSGIFVSTLFLLYIDRTFGGLLDLNRISSTLDMKLPQDIGDMVGLIFLFKAAIWTGFSGSLLVPVNPVLGSAINTCSLFTGIIVASTLGNTFSSFVTTVLYLIFFGLISVSGFALKEKVARVDENC